MSQPPTTGATRAETPPGPRSASTGERLGVGAGLSGGTGPLALPGLEQGISR